MTFPDMPAGIPCYGEKIPCSFAQGISAQPFELAAVISRRIAPSALKTEKFPVFSLISREFGPRSLARFAPKLWGAAEQRDRQTAHCAS